MANGNGETGLAKVAGDASPAPRAGSEAALARAGFGGGCHWCTEGVFAQTPGVVDVRQGWIKGPPPDDAFSEAVIVAFDPRAAPLEKLIELHLLTHASTSDHAMRGKYRSAVYVFDSIQGREAGDALARLQSMFDRPLVTRVIEFADFKASDERYRRYYEKNGDGPFVRDYITPKLARIDDVFPDRAKDKR